MNAFLLHHCDDLEWVRRQHGPDAQLIAHEDYLPGLLEMAIPCFFKHGSYAANVDETIDFFCHNWHRDVAGNDLLANGGLSIAEVFSTGLLICVPGVCREYFALAYWCERYDCVQVSCNEPDSFLNIAKNFSPRVQIYDPGHRQTSLLKSFSERVLRVPPLDWRLRILRQLQTPFLPTLRGRTLALNAWTLGEYARKNAWLTENSRFPWRSAYARRPSQICLDEAERLVQNSARGIWPQFCSA